MKFIAFEIFNFKGIEHLVLDLNKSPKINIFTLVGLNESGKTTILEAINFFNRTHHNLASLNLEQYLIKDIHDLIPMNKRDNFNESITITAKLELEDVDINEVDAYAKENLGVAIHWEKINKVITITSEHPFKDSVHDRTTAKYFWDLFFYTSPLKGRGKGKEKLLLSDTEEFTALSNCINSRIPSILYFPTFLFEFPEKINLEQKAGEHTKHSYYRKLVQDILDSLENELTIEKHLLERAQSTLRYDKKNLDSVLLKMGQKVTHEIFEAWNKIFGRELQNKEVIFDIDCDESNENHYLQLFVKDNDGQYLMSERSLGFRWFFCFLLFTRFRGFRIGSPSNLLFLLDEPASNLHSTAQTQLLNSLEKVTETNCKIIYSTHSHHLINPLWLEGVYIVKNNGLDYDNAVTSDYNSKKTNITIDAYRSFVSKYPTQTTYFQPILDTLDYSPSNLENIPNVIFLEGKNDFYSYKYFNEIIFGTKFDISFMPGSGARSLGTLISLYLGWSRQFIILLDSDKQGKEAKEYYINTYGLPDTQVFTYEDINPEWKNKGLEKLLLDADKLLLQKSIFKDSNQQEYKKTLFNRAVQELLVSKRIFEFSTQTLENIEEVLIFIHRQIALPNELALKV